MKQVEKILGLTLTDLKEMQPALKEAYSRISKDYFETTHPKLKMLDCLIVLSLLTFVLQVVYAQIMGKDPFNSYLAGVFCSLGQFALCGKNILFNMCSIVESATQ